jgi:hypothetical protein
MRRRRTKAEEAEAEAEAARIMANHIAGGVARAVSKGVFEVPAILKALATDPLFSSSFRAAAASVSAAPMATRPVLKQRRTRFLLPPAVLFSSPVVREAAGRGEPAAIIPLT